MSGTAKNALLDDPGIRPNFQHVEIVIGFENKTVCPTQVNFDMIGDVAEVGADGYLGAVRAKGESDRVGGIMGNTNGMDVDITNREALAGLDGLHTTQALAKRFGKNALHGAQGGFGDVERGFPETEHLREAVTVVGVLVGDEDAVDVLDASFDSGEARKRFALAETGVDEEAGALGLEQSDVARAARRQNGYSEADR